MKRSAILGLGHYVPSKVVTNDDLAKMFDTSDEWIQQRTGIKERRYIEESGIGASDLAVPAVEMACKNAGIDVSEIDAIIFATLSPDFNFPGSGCFLGDKLGLAGVPALDVRNQCSGFLYGLQIADAWKAALDAGHDKTVLLCDYRVRPQLAALLSRQISQLPVLAYDEISIGTKIESVGTITLHQAPAGGRAEIPAGVG